MDVKAVLMRRAKLTAVKGGVQGHRGLGLEHGHGLGHAFRQYKAFSQLCVGACFGCGKGKGQSFGNCSLLS